VRLFPYETKSFSAFLTPRGNEVVTFRIREIERVNFLEAQGRKSLGDPRDFCPWAIVQKDSSMLTFACPSCQTKLQAADEHAGKTIQCPTCQAKAIVPTPAADAMTAMFPSRRVLLRAGFDRHDDA